MLQKFEVYFTSRIQLWFSRLLFTCVCKCWVSLAILHRGTVHSRESRTFCSIANLWKCSKIRKALNKIYLIKVIDNWICFYMSYVVSHRDFVEMIYIMKNLSFIWRKSKSLDVNVGLWHSVSSSFLYNIMKESLGNKLAHLTYWYHYYGAAQTLKSRKYLSFWAFIGDLSLKLAYFFIASFWPLNLEFFVFLDDVSWTFRSKVMEARRSRVAAFLEVGISILNIMAQDNCARSFVFKGKKNPCKDWKWHQDSAPAPKGHKPQKCCKEEWANFWPWDMWQPLFSGLFTIWLWYLGQCWEEGVLYSSSKCGCPQGHHCWAVGGYVQELHDQGLQHS